MGKKKPYALHLTTHLRQGQKFYISADDLVQAYGLTAEDQWIVWDERKKMESDLFIHLKATPDILEKLFPDELGEYALYE